MVNNSITFIGLDTRKEFFEVAYFEDNHEAAIAPSSNRHTRNVCPIWGSFAQCKPI